MSYLTDGSLGSLPVVDLLTMSWTTARDLLKGDGADLTGRRWRRPEQRCPGWCDKGHKCTAKDGYPGGEHRSPTSQWKPWYGQLTATRVQTIAGRQMVDVHAVVDVHGITPLGTVQALTVPVVVDLAVRTALAEAVWFTELDGGRPRLAVGQ